MTTAFIDASSLWRHPRRRTGVTEAVRELIGAASPAPGEVTTAGSVATFAFDDFGAPRSLLRLPYHDEPDRTAALLGPVIAPLPGDVVLVFVTDELPTPSASPSWLPPDVRYLASIDGQRGMSVAWLRELAIRVDGVVSTSRSSVVDLNRELLFEGLDRRFEGDGFRTLPLGPAPDLVKLFAPEGRTSGRNLLCSMGGGGHELLRSLLVAFAVCIDEGLDLTLTLTGTIPASEREAVAALLRRHGVPNRLWWVEDPAAPHPLDVTSYGGLLSLNGAGEVEPLLMAALTTGVPIALSESSVHRECAGEDVHYLPAMGSVEIEGALRLLAAEDAVDRGGSRQNDAWEGVLGWIFDGTSRRPPVRPSDVARAEGGSGADLLVTPTSAFSGTEGGRTALATLKRQLRDRGLGGVARWPVRWGTSLLLLSGTRARALRAETTVLGLEARIARLETIFDAHASGWFLFENRFDNLDSVTRTTALLGDRITALEAASTQRSDGPPAFSVTNPGVEIHPQLVAGSISVERVWRSDVDVADPSEILGALLDGRSATRRRSPLQALCETGTPVGLAYLQVTTLGRSEVLVIPAGDGSTLSRTLLVIDAFESGVQRRSVTVVGDPPVGTAVDALLVDGVSEDVEWTEVRRRLDGPMGVLSWEGTVVFVLGLDGDDRARSRLQSWMVGARSVGMHPSSIGLLRGVDRQGDRPEQLWVIVEATPEIE